MSTLKIGDKLYRYVTLAGVFEYTIIALRISARDVAYEVRCDSCNHGWNCECLIQRNDYNKLSFVCMLNNSDDDDQRHWHNDDPDFISHFWTTKQEAYAERGNFLIKQQEDKVAKSKEILKQHEETLRKIKEAYKVGTGSTS